MTNQKETLVKICQAVDILLKLVDEEWELVEIKLQRPDKDKKGNIKFVNGKPVKSPFCICIDGTSDPNCKCKPPAS